MVILAVKLNDPLMGTETNLYLRSYRISNH